MKQQTTSLQQQWLQAQHAMASRQPLRPRQPLCIDDQQVGSIEEDFARKLGQELDLFSFPEEIGDRKSVV